MRALTSALHRISHSQSLISNLSISARVGFMVLSVLMWWDWPGRSTGFPGQRSGRRKLRHAFQADFSRVALLRRGSAGEARRRFAVPATSFNLEFFPHRFD